MNALCFSYEIKFIWQGFFNMCTEIDTCGFAFHPYEMMLLSAWRAPHIRKLSTFYAVSHRFWLHCLYNVKARVLVMLACVHLLLDSACKKKKKVELQVPSSWYFIFLITLAG